MKSLLPMSALDRANVECPTCEGSGWVCENHEDLPWDNGPGGPFSNGCACGAGAPCRCNPLHRDYGRQA